MSPLTGDILVIFVCEGHGADQFPRGISMLEVSFCLFGIAGPPNLHTSGISNIPGQLR